MLVFEFKCKATKQQYQAIDEAIRIGQFIRNKCLRYWMDASREKKVNYAVLCQIIPDLCKEFPFAEKLNSMARQASAERTWFAVSRFFDNCKKKVPGKKGYPKFKKHSRSVEYKTSGYKISDERKYLTITDKTGIGKLKLIGSRNLSFYDKKLIKRVRLIRRADGYYAQFGIDFSREELLPSTGKIVGIDVGITSFYTDSNGNKVDNPKYLRKSEKRLKKAQRRLSKRFKKGKQQSKRYHKQRNKVAKIHLKVSRQRKDFAVKTAKTLICSNDAVVYEELKIKNMVKNRKLSKSISDASWSIFTNWLDYFGKIHGRYVESVAPHFTSQNCSNCGEIVKKSLSVKTHICSCGCVLDRDENAAVNILRKVFPNTAGQAGIYAQGQTDLCLISESLLDKLTG